MARLDDEQALVHRLARRSGRTVKGGRYVTSRSPGALKPFEVPPSITWAPGQEPLPTCEWPTIDASGRERECRRIATHHSFYGHQPTNERDFCAYHAIEAAAHGEVFEPAEWLRDVGSQTFAASRRSIDGT